MMKLHFYAVATVLFAPAAFALTPPTLPPSAKLLGAEEVVALYDGSTIAFQNYTRNKPLKGTSHSDFKKGTISGDFVLGKKKGTFEGTIRMKGQEFCYTVNGDIERCMSIYMDGSDIYEVDSRKVVTSKNKRL